MRDMASSKIPVVKKEEILLLHIRLKFVGLNAEMERSSWLTTLSNNKAVIFPYFPFQGINITGEKNCYNMVNICQNTHNGSPRIFASCSNRLREIPNGWGSFISEVLSYFWQYSFTGIWQNYSLSIKILFLLADAISVLEPNEMLINSKLIECHSPVICQPGVWGVSVGVTYGLSMSKITSIN